MKIIDWFKNLLKKTSRKDYMLSDVNSSVNNSKSNKDFVTKIDVNGIKTEKTRETQYTNCKTIYRVPRKMIAGDEGVSARRL